MTKYEIQKVYAFSSPQGGGSPAGVLIGAESLSEDQMQAIAKEIGFSETAFVSSSSIADFRLDFFTPNRRIPDCGHATVAAFSLLKTRDPSLLKSSKEIITGIRGIHFEGDSVYMEQPLAGLSDVPQFQQLIQTLFEEPKGFKSGWIARHDVGFLLIEVDSEENLQKAAPRFKSIIKYTDDNDLVGVYLFVRKSTGPVLAETRMFAPAYGIEEEPATGMAAGLLCALFFHEAGKSKFTIEQGRYMTPSSPSLIKCRVLPDHSKVLVGGTARSNKSDTIFVDI